MFYLENDLEHICYIHESMVDDPVVKTALTIRKHLDRYWYSLPTYCGEKGYCTLKIAPLYVASGDYLEDDVSFLALPDNNWTAAASWKLLPDNQIELQFTTGETEILEIAEDMPEITIKTLNRTFYSSVGEARLNPDIAS